MFLEKKLDGEGSMQRQEEDCCKTDNLSHDAVISLAAPAGGAADGGVRKPCRPGE